MKFWKDWHWSSGMSFEQIPIMDLDGQTGATGALANKFELQLYNLRHIQQHTGELYERLSPYRI